MSDFRAAPVAWVGVECTRAGRKGVWHFNPRDWAILWDAFGPPDPLRPKILFGLDVTVSETFPSPPRLVSK